MAQQDQSVADIMASIRRIMAEDGADENKPAPATGASGAADPDRPTPTVEIDPPSETEQPLLLTDPADGDGEQSDPHDVLLLTDPLDPVPGVADDQSPVLPDQETDPAPETGTDPDQRVASPIAEAAVAAALTRLTRESLDQAHQESADDPGRAVLEKVIRDALRPALRSWLDENLPPIVEAIVEREVTRLMQERKPS
jgi:hypothetical protein